MSALRFETAPYSELCGCVSIHLNDMEIRALDFATRAGRRNEFMERKFNDGRERTYLAECPKCDAGMAHHTEQSA